MKTTHTLSLLLATSVCLIAHAAPPVFTFTTGLARGGWWGCANYPDRPQGQSLAVTATSDGTVSLTGTCTESASATVTFTRTAVKWRVGQDWWGCGRCASFQGEDCRPSQPRISCNVPFYTEFVSPHTAYGGAYSGNAQTSWGLVWWETQGGSFEQEAISANGDMGFTFCRDDFDASGAIDGGDISMMMLWWGSNNANGLLYFCSRMDLDDDGEVGSSDLSLLLLDWGECPTPDV